MSLMRSDPDIDGRRSFAAATVDGFAIGADTAGGAVAIRVTGSQPPIFFMPTDLGDHSYVTQLVPNIDGDIPIYVLPPPALAHKPPRTIEAMADRVLPLIRAIQPQGPYRLAGYSLGGILAYALAERFSSLDEEVSFVGLIGTELRAAATPTEMLLDHLLAAMTDDASRAALTRTSATLSLVELAREGLGVGALAPDVDAETWARLFERASQFRAATLSYHPLPLPRPVTFFTAEQRPVSKPAAVAQMALEWERLPPRDSVKSIPVPATQASMIGDVAHCAVLGAEISRAVQAPIGSSRPFDPLFPMNFGRRTEAPLYCVPGAGASITTFAEFAGALTGGRPVHGLQPRGVDSADLPHGSVEAAAACNVSALVAAHPSGPLHLIGHSHGGAVVFEMARRLREHGRRVESLTLVDTEAPGLDDGDGDVDERQIRYEFVQAIKLSFDVAPVFDEPGLASAQSRLEYVRHVHKGLVSAGVLPARSNPEILRGPLASFAAARRNAYRPAAPHPGKLRLVLVRNPLLDAERDALRRQACIAGWQSWADELEVWHGPGHHFSILRPPHVRQLAEWWQQGIA